jgi:flagella basal body P-ring formation protein FlgA
VVLSVFLFFLSSFSSYGAESVPAVSTMLRNEISKSYPGARVELTSEVRWDQQIDNGALSGVRFIQVNSDDVGRVYFTATTEDDNGQHLYNGTVNFAALVPAEVAVRRIQPGEALSPQLFILQDINIASSQWYLYKGLVMSTTTVVSGLQTRQTILEGQPLLSSSVEKIPDVRRGDEIQVHLVSGGLTLSTIGVSEETGYVNNSIRVMTQKTKRELVGKLLPGNIVEVRL